MNVSAMEGCMTLLQIVMGYIGAFLMVIWPLTSTGLTLQTVIKWRLRQVV